MQTYKPIRSLVIHIAICSVEPCRRTTRPHFVIPTTGTQRHPRASLDLFLRDVTPPEDWSPSSATIAFSIHEAHLFSGKFPTELNAQQMRHRLLNITTAQLHMKAFPRKPWNESLLRSRAEMEMTRQRRQISLERRDA